MSGPPSSETTAYASADTWHSASLVKTDQLLRFAPGTFNYARDRGTESTPVVRRNFGVAPNLTASVLIDSTGGETPDLKRRVRVNLQAAAGIPNGQVTVRGKVYTRNSDPAHPGYTSQDQSETLTFNAAGTKTTLKYFDAVTSIETPGLGVNCDATVSMWSGHEQELDVGVEIAGPDEMASCEHAWKVRINGQIATPSWDWDTRTCSAGLVAGLGMLNGELVANDAFRGLYFPVIPDHDSADTFHHYRDGDFEPVAKRWSDWLGSVGAARPWFDVDRRGANETRMRPIVIQLVRTLDNNVIDAARLLMAIEVDPNGLPSLVAMSPDIENPGAIAQLSPSGLDHLERTHQATLPYPIVPAGTQPRLSRSAIADPQHTSPEVDVKLSDLSPADLKYWTKPGPNGEKFAGRVAYDKMTAAAVPWLKAFRDGIEGCAGDLKCEAPYRVFYCVQHETRDSDMEIRIAGVHTYFDPDRPDDALVINDVTNLDLSYGSDQILAKFALANIQGWLEASVAPADIKLVWRAGPPTCVFGPKPQVLSEIASGLNDYNDWLRCKQLSLAADKGLLADPIHFDLETHVEQLDTRFAVGRPGISLQGVSTDPGAGICDQPWMSPTITTEITGWQPDVEVTISKELVRTPGEDEALKRLLSPYELGVTTMDQTPVATPPYVVHPLPTYRVSARFGATASDANGMTADSTHGLYLPYLTQSSPAGGVTPYASWFCPVGGGQFCNGLAGAHEPKLLRGLDPGTPSTPGSPGTPRAPYDVSINYTTAHINQALWAQAARSDRLGSPGLPGRLAISDTAVADAARAAGFADLVQALDAVGTRFGVRYHQEAAPYTVINDVVPPQLIYTAQNVVVELVSVASDGSETVVAKLVMDVIDFDHQLAFQSGGVPALAATWRQKQDLSLTTTYLPDCFDDPALGSGSCNGHLQAVLTSMWISAVEDSLLDMIEQQPALQLFDSGQESPSPTRLNNPRTFLENEGVVLVGDLCRPGTVDCP